MVAPMDIETLTRKRKTITSKIRQVEDTIVKHATEPLNLIKVEWYLKSLASYHQEASALHDEVIATCKSGEEEDVHFASFRQHEASIIECHEALVKLQQELQPKAEATLSKFDELSRKRRAIFNDLKAIRDRAAAHDTTPITLHQAECDLSEVLTLKSKFVSISDDILLYIPEDRVAPEYENNHTVAAVALEAMASLRTIIVSLQPPSTSTTNNENNNSNNHNSHIRLPTIQLPTFDGKYEDWSTFKDLFTATVDSNASLGRAMKLQYLIASLKGEPATIIKSLKITDDNYVLAWTTINERYDNKREIITAILNRLFDQPVLTSESGSSLQELVDTTNECTRSLEVMDRRVEHWGDIIVHLVSRRLDPETRRRWVMSLKRNEVPDFPKMQEFLEQTIRSLMADTAASSQTFINESVPVSRNPKHNQQQPRKISANQASASVPCPICKSTHFIYKCSEFLSFDADKRRKFITDASRCFNCLRTGHGVSNCPSPHRCKKCQGNHNTLLHQDKQQQDKAENLVSIKATVANHHGGRKHVNHVLLPTAIVEVDDKNGLRQQCRVLLDSGSEASFITKGCMEKLGLYCQPADAEITGIGNTKGTKASGLAHIRLHAREGERTIGVNALVLPKVTGILSPAPHDPQKWFQDCLKKPTLADPSSNVASGVDILLGADYIGDVYLSGVDHGNRWRPTGYNTIFGYVLSGRVNTDEPLPDPSKSNHGMVKFKSMNGRPIYIPVPDTDKRR